MDVTTEPVFSIDNQGLDSVVGRLVALVGFDDHELEHRLINDGAVLCDPLHPEVELLVFDPAKESAHSISKQLGSQAVERLRAGQIQIVSRLRLMDSYGQRPADIRRLYTVSMLAQLLGVSVSTIRGWHRRGLILPVNRVSKLPYFDYQEVCTAKQLATLVELGMEPATIESNLRQLQVWLPDVSRPLAQLAVMADGKRLVLRQADGLIETGGQRLLDFGTQNPTDVDDSVPVPETDQIYSLQHYRDRLQPETRQDFLDAITACEEEGDFEAAIVVHRSMHLAWGPTAESNFMLGELLYRVGEIHAARERFYQAIELDDSMVETRAALGCVLVELGDFEAAISTFQGALDLHADYADVHFQLARCLQDTGKNMPALMHWKRFVQLQPNGPWAEDAQEQIAFLQSLVPEVVAP